MTVGMWPWTRSVHRTQYAHVEAICSEAQPVAVRSLRIPESQAQYFRLLLEAPSEVLSRLPGLLAEGALSWSARDFEERLAQDADLDPKVVQAATVVASSLLVTLERGTMPASALPEAVARGVGEHVELPQDSGEWVRLVQFLGAVLEAPGNFGVSRKVQQVAVDHERPFVDARIITDVRPIFDADGANVATSVIVHTLGVETIQRGEHRDKYFFALDRSDLLQLRELVERALRKEGVLREQVRAAGWTVVEAGVGGESDE